MEEKKSTSFGLHFTDSKLYDLEKIKDENNRENSEKPISMQVIDANEDIEFKEGQMAIVKNGNKIPITQKDIRRILFGN